MRRTTAGVVVYGTAPQELAPLFTSLHDDPAIAAWIVCDNAAAERLEEALELKQFTESMGGIYLAAPRNLGFGGGHNAALESSRLPVADFHLMVNPDISMGDSVLTALQTVMDERQHVSLLLPRVVYPDGGEQYLAKLLPTPLDFALRRFAPGAVQRLAAKRMAQYELRGLAHTESEAVPFLSGCFMFTRRSALQAVGGFDERFFLYLEDVDLCRRIAAKGTLLYYPRQSVVHGYHRGAHRNTKLMYLFLRSAVLYFNKWGWLFDAHRKRANAAAVAELNAAGTTATN